MNLFGTDGIRATMGTYPLNEETLPHIGAALAQWALEKYGNHATFLVASDTRISCGQIKKALFSAFSDHTIPVYDAQIFPTPAVFNRMAQDSTFTCGIIISASHNKAEDNGIKVVAKGGEKISLDDELRISSLIYEKKGKALVTTPYKEPLLLQDAEEHYIASIMNLFPPSFLKGKKVVIDCAHGAFYQIAPHIFSAFGAELIVLNATPTGFNINDRCGATYLEPLQQEVVSQKAFFGIAFDGDGDRCMGVTTSGKIVDGDDTLALLLTHPHYQSTPAVVSTIMANQGLEAYVTSRGKKLIRTSVGDKHILKALKEHSLIVGGEPSGHTLITPLSGTGDGIIVALKLLETLLLTGNYQCITFDKYPQVSINIPVKEKKDLTAHPFAEYIADSAAQLPHGRLLIRYSGTEHLLRIMGEDKDQTLCNLVTTALSERLKELLY